MIVGMNAATGRALGDQGHIRQSIADILTTPIGSRIGRRDYGSLVPQLIDHPANAANRLRLMSATVGAIARWEPRVRITQVDFNVNASGAVSVGMDAVIIDGQRTGQNVSMAVRIA